MSLPTSANLSLSQINSCMRFTNGNVGIGTTAPSYKLDISGTINATTFYQNGSVFSGGGGGGVAFNTTLNTSTDGTSITSASPLIVNGTSQNTVAYSIYMPTSISTGNNFTITNTGSTTASYANIYSNLFVRMGSSTTSGSLARLRKGETIRVVAKSVNPTLPSGYEKIITRRTQKSGLSAIKWTNRSIPNARFWQSVCWAPELGLFCAVNYNSGAVVMTSPDGVSWTERSIPNSRTWNAITWASELGLFCCINNGTAAFVMTSSDGITWTERSIPNNRPWNSICWAPELRLFCAVNQTAAVVMTSPDGITWTERAIPNARSWTSITWAPELGIFCAVCVNVAVVMTSPDGITWTERSSSAAYRICWAPEVGLFCGVNYNTAVVMTSPNGINWTDRKIPSVLTCYSICWSPELMTFCAVNSDNTAGKNLILINF